MPGIDRRIVICYNIQIEQWNGPLLEAPLQEVTVGGGQGG